MNAIKWGKRIGEETNIWKLVIRIMVCVQNTVIEF